MKNAVQEWEELKLELDPLVDAVRWAERNPHAYQQLRRWAIEDVENGCRPSIGLYFELLRRPHFSRRLGLQRMSASLLLNNNLRSGLARLLNRDYGLGFPVRDSWAEKGGKP